MESEAGSSSRSGECSESYSDSYKELTRRDFIKKAAVASAMAGPVSLAAFASTDPGQLPNGPFAGRTGPLRVGLVGCGRRGTGAAINAARADSAVRITALADTFQDQVSACATNLSSQLGAQFDVPTSRVFTGFDAFQRLLASGVDIVLLATPPHFRPAHIEAAIQAGVHVFAEKPVAVDVPGVKRVIAAAALAQQRGLSIVSGYCYRYDRAMTETVRQIQSGAIGEIRSIYCAYNKGAWDLLPRQPQWSEMEFQVRNYRHYVWLQGDIILELSHNIDKISWILGEYPVRAWGMGGRQSDNTSACFDHHAVVYEYASGLRLTSYNRAVQGADFENADVLYGTQGAASLMDYEITGARPWIYSGPRNDMYQTQLDTLVAAIRAGRPVNDGEWMAKSTFMGILGRWASYTGRKIEWTRAWNSTQVLGPPAYSWGPAPAERIAIPGRTRLT